MQIAKFIAIILFSTLTFSACSSQMEAPKDSLLQEAQTLFLQSKNVEDEVDQTMKKLIQERNHLQVKGQTLSPDEMAFSDQFAAIQSRLDAWKHNRIEVLHDHSKCNHKHDHPQLTPQQMLDIQKEALEIIEGISTDTRQLKQK